MLDIKLTAPAADALTPLSFSSASFAMSEALDAWRGWFGQLNEIVPAPDAPFSARVDYWRVGKFVVASNVSSPMRLVRPPGRARKDGLDHWVLRVSRSGVVRSRSGDLAYVSRPGELVLERLTGCYDDDWSSDEWMALIFPPGVFPSIDRRLETLATGPVPGVGAALLGDFLLALDKRLALMTQADVGPVARATCALVAAIAPTEDRAETRPGIAARLRAEQVIRANIASARLESRRIAALSGVSRSTLYRLFEEDGGVAAHVRRLRLDAVHAALRDPDKRDRTIGEIAAEAGFHCVSSFNRAFRAHFGVPPGEVRKAENPTQAEAASALSGADFLDVLFRRGKSVLRTAEPQRLHGG